jgi:hypothetical protein
VSAPRYLPEDMRSLARALAGAALAELMTEMAEAPQPHTDERRDPPTRKARRSKDFDDADNTTVSENR